MVLERPKSRRKWAVLPFGSIWPGDLFSLLLHHATRPPLFIGQGTKGTFPMAAMPWGISANLRRLEPPNQWDFVDISGPSSSLGKMSFGFGLPWSQILKALKAFKVNLRATSKPVSAWANQAQPESITSTTQTSSWHMHPKKNNFH